MHQLHEEKIKGFVESAEQINIPSKHVAKNVAPHFQLKTNSTKDAEPEKDSANNTLPILSGIDNEDGEENAEQLKSVHESHNVNSQSKPPPFQLKSGTGSSDVLRQMSGSFGTDLTDVNIYKDSQKASEANALAYTQGNDVHFAPGQYNPSSQSGKELLGHELTHVVQQREDRVQANNEVNGRPLNDDKGLEQEADDMGRLVAQGKKDSNLNIENKIGQQKSSPIQRWVDGNPNDGKIPEKDAKNSDKSDPLLPSIFEVDKSTGLVGVTIPKWTIQSGSLYNINKGRNTSEITVLSIPIPDFGTFDISFQAGMDAGLNVSSDIYFYDLNLKMTKMTALTLLASLGFAVFNPLTVINPLSLIPLLTALRLGYIEGAGNLMAAASAKAHIGAHASGTGSLRVLGIKGFDIATLQGGVSGNLTADMLGEINQKTKLVLDQGQLKFSAASKLRVNGNITAILTASLEATILKLFKARYQKNWSKNILDVKGEWIQGDMTLIYNNGIKDGKDDSMFTIRQESITAFVTSIAKAMNATKDNQNDSQVSKIEENNDENNKKLKNGNWEENFTSEEKEVWINELGEEKTQQVHNKFGVKAMKAYSPGFFKRLDGLSDKQLYNKFFTSHTYRHAIDGEGIRERAVKGCHDTDIFINRHIHTTNLAEKITRYWPREYNNGIYFKYTGPIRGEKTTFRNFKGEWTNITANALSHFKNEIINATFPNVMTTSKNSGLKFVTHGQTWQIWINSDFIAQSIYPILKKE